MDSFSGRGSRQAAPARNEAPVTRPEPVRHETPVATKSKRVGRPRPLVGLLWTILGLVVLGAGAWFIWTSLNGSAVSGVKGGQYQAVFLTNGQVYFGKLAGQGANFYKLSNVFYLQASTGATEDQANPQEATDSSNVQLIKLGNEVHGPEDTMIVARNQVLFFENLKGDGKVAKTITEYNDKNK